MRRFFSRLLLATALLLALTAIVLAWLLNSPIPLREATLELEIEQGSSMRQVARQVQAAGIDVNPLLFELLARGSGQAQKVKAGSYEVSAGETPLTLLRKLVRGDSTQGEFVVVDGWTFRRLREELAKLPGLRITSAGLSDAELLARLGVQQSNGEGLFLPDTYFYAKGGTDLQLLARAQRAMTRHLERAWSARAPGLPLNSPQEALIMASLIEKETGLAADRPTIGSVFYNRLRIDMPLQTDPTVIYGLGPGFDGNLRKIDLQTDTPYNTYTRRGLPPTPIAMPGKAAIAAALHPPATPYFYFVARGDGSSEFSRTLDQHNRAVARYQKRKGNNR
ncbi:endolytic transglycosylase MltG [Niveibacterium sp. 24ML]|uniref:endolytic transglycosylase MltG n=1 Tax=Niveibacterium sp. 24ML TaxID=2985512 RepID=UPI00226E8F34|nr:endolytic transglycosylase MltG [Niveibacterium sp. 24ML]MCX9156731.1 endolytic transglycosylase MltG [Niveibacterium sp. 24ML]